MNAAIRTHPLMQYEQDEQCSACSYVEDICPYHRGGIDAMEWMAQMVYAIASDPEIATYLEQIIARRPDLKITRS